MTFKSRFWYPVAVVLSVGNLVAVWFATGPTAPWHAMAHAVLAVAFGGWAHWLRHRQIGGERASPEAVEALDALEALEGELRQVRLELSEAQERLDFAERQLAKVPEPRRASPGDQGPAAGTR